MNHRVARFLVMGVVNTAVYFIFYRILLLKLNYLPAHVIAFAVGVLVSFFGNCYFTYHVKPTWRRFLMFPATTMINFVVTTVGSVVLVRGLEVSDRWATLLATALAVPFTYLATTYVLTGRGSSAE